MIARHLEINGFPTVTLNMFKEVGEYNQPPRILYTENDFGMPFGRPHDDVSQLNLVKACLNQFNK